MFNRGPMKEFLRWTIYPIEVANTTSVIIIPMPIIWTLSKMVTSNIQLQYLPLLRILLRILRTCYEIIILKKTILGIYGLNSPLTETTIGGRRKHRIIRSIQVPNRKCFSHVHQNHLQLILHQVNAFSTFNFTVALAEKLPKCHSSVPATLEYI